MNDKLPLLSIVCPTYNHERFIAQTLDGFVMQKTRFRFEIIVHDDASTDGTAARVKQYEAKYPDLFSNIYQTENQFSKEISNVMRNIMSAARGKYIALCEGDDYWTDAYKLEKQVSFLEQNPDFIATFHNVSTIDDSNRFVENVYLESRKSDMTIDDLGAGDYLKTCSLVFRNETNILAPVLENQIPLEDTSIGFCLLTNGRKAHYFREIMAVYRMHAGGMWSMKDLEQRYNLIYDNTIKYYQFFQDEGLRRGLKDQLKAINRTMIKYHIRRMNLLKGIQSASRFIKHSFTL